MSLLVAIEGIDGSGKGTQAKRLCEHLHAAGRTTRLISFPRYEATTAGRVIGEFLNGRYGALDEIDPYLCALLYAGDRWESRPMLLEALAAHDVVVLDRYVASNIAHQGAKATGADRESLIRRIQRLEFELNELPRPDRVILLDLPVSQAQTLIGTKPRRTYTAKAADLQEANAAYLEQVREVYLHLAAEDDAWTTIDGVRDGAIRSIDEIGTDVWRTVESLLL